MNKIEDLENIRQDRAWIEINLDNLEYNINQIMKIINNKTKIMAVVKANSYGLGMIEISKKLNEIGIEDFAVATLSEGITLRKNNIKGNILILGYTDFKDIEYVIKYDLIQTIIDYEYAKTVNELNLERKLKAHVKVNTGMNRIGESYKNVDKLTSIYKMENLNVLGTFSHLCVADELKEESREFTKAQINNFFTCINKLKELGCNIGKIHIQSSYGIFNYPNLECDYIRPGIIMYGVYSSSEDKRKIDIKPVMNLKARITSIKEINKGETVSYGRTFMANELRKIATVSIGYADGYPRNLSNKNAKVVIKDKYAEIIGRICMDQLVIDVTDIDEVHQGDIVTLIGDKKEITAEKIANKSNTITNELICRLGNRLGRIVI